MKKNLIAQFTDHSETKSTTVDYKFAAEVITNDPEVRLVFWSKTATGAAKLADRCVAAAQLEIEQGGDFAQIFAAQQRRAGQVIEVLEAEALA